MKKLYTCRLGLNMMVVAESQDEAQKIAYDNMKKEYIMPNDFYCTESRYIESGWTDEDEPYGNNEGKTVREWLPFRNCISNENFGV